ncbi:hypothetical protein, partial [Brevibacterium aurantiacum]|uniref:hypothetical protein n=1 Tax=Brevibacterium aurantiacum TaxID=273384 RepID=UPI0015E11495
DGLRGLAVYELCEEGVLESAFVICVGNPVDLLGVVMALLHGKHDDLAPVFAAVLDAGLVGGFSSAARLTARREIVVGNSMSATLSGAV